MLILLALLLRAALGGWRLQPASTTPCRYPYLLDADGQTRAYCGASARLGARRLLALAGHPCRSKVTPLYLAVGDHLTLDAACRGRRRRSHGAERLLLGLAVDLNRASVAELRVLPRIGPKLARRIVAERSRRGPFRSLDELAPRVRGIGRRTVQLLRGLADAAAPVAAKARPRATRVRSAR